MIFTSHTSNMDEEVYEAHKLCCEAILTETGLRRAPAASSTSTTTDEMTSPEDLETIQPPPTADSSSI
jgi:hypothetical protein